MFLLNYSRVEDVKMKSRASGVNREEEGAIHSHYSENVLLKNSFFDDKCRKELKEINKHEIIVKICEILGPCPSNLCTAEEILETIKYEIANYVIHHEYESPNGVSADLLLWLDSKINPGYFKKLNEFIDKFFK